MYLCDEHDKAPTVVLHEDHDCPLCEALKEIEELKEKLSDKQAEVDDAEGRVNDAEAKVEELEKELQDKE